MRNAGLKYICKQVHLRVETADSPFTNQLKKGEVLQIPIGHMEGNYFCEPEELGRLEAEDRIAFRYATPKGEITRGGESERVAEQYCGNFERGAERAGNDAASGPVEREAAGVGGWVGDLRVDGWGAGEGSELASQPDGAGESASRQARRLMDKSQ